MGKLEDAALREGPRCAFADRLGDYLAGLRTMQKVKRELHFREVQLAQNAHAQDPRIEIQ